MPRTVKIVKGFERWQAGQVVTVGGGVADAWIRRGVAVPAPEAPVIETAAVQTVAETADRTPRKRGRR
jgi:hypothetical protein